MIVALLLMDICFLLSHLCEGIDWMFYPLATTASISFIKAFSSYENLKKRIEKLERKGGAE